MSESQKQTLEIEALVSRRCDELGADAHAWTLSSDGSWAPVDPVIPTKPVNHQAAMMRRARQRSRRQTDGRTRKAP